MLRSLQLHVWGPTLGLKLSYFGVRVRKWAWAEGDLLSECCSQNKNKQNKTIEKLTRTESQFPLFGPPRLLEAKARLLRAGWRISQTGLPTMHKRVLSRVWYARHQTEELAIA
eukprot:4426781-Amphidinium_carterae.1